MKILNLLGCAMLALGMIGLFGSIIIPRSLVSRAQLIQRVTPYDPDTAALAGELGTPVGAPQLMVIDQEAAFLDGSGEQGARLVDDNYLKKNNIYPLQVKTIKFVASLVRIGSGAIAIVGLPLFLWTRKRIKIQGGVSLKSSQC